MAFSCAHPLFARCCFLGTHERFVYLEKQHVCKASEAIPFFRCTTTPKIIKANANKLRGSGFPTQKLLVAHSWKSFLRCPNGSVAGSGASVGFLKFEKFFRKSSEIFGNSVKIRSFWETHGFSQNRLCQMAPGRGGLRPTSVGTLRADGWKAKAKHGNRLPGCNYIYYIKQFDVLKSYFPRKSTDH